jgi:hypothetical protein
LKATSLFVSIDTVFRQGCLSVLKKAATPLPEAIAAVTMDIFEIGEIGLLVNQFMIFALLVKRLETVVQQI